MTTEEWGRISSDAFNVALFGYIAAMVAAFAHIAFGRRAFHTASVAIAMAALLANGTSIVARGLAAGRTPWGNMYEYSMMLSFVVVLAFLVMVEGVYRVRTVGGFVYAFAVLTMAMAAMFFSVGPEALQPALNSYWRQIHVTSMITASALLGIGCVLTLLYLVRERSERRALAALGSRMPPPIMGGAVGVDTPPDYVPPDEEPVVVGADRRGVLPSAETLDRLAYRFIAFGFPIWTFGTICGAIWAQNAWSRYWGWDPKETWSFITWVIFAGYLHARATNGWKGRRAAVIALVGFVSLFITYYVVNLWIAGLHSYAK